MKKSEKGLLKISEAAHFLNVHPNTLRHWDESGILKATRFGQRGDRRYKKEELIRLTTKK